MTAVVVLSLALASAWRSAEAAATRRAKRAARDRGAFEAGTPQRDARPCPPPAAHNVPKFLATETAEHPAGWGSGPGIGSRSGGGVA